MLDKPGLASETGRKFFLYYPKYWDSATLAALVRRVGMTEADDDVELQGGIDTVRADVGLNALMFYTSPFSQKAIERILKEYDAPVTMAISASTFRRGRTVRARTSSRRGRATRAAGTS